MEKLRVLVVDDNSHMIHIVKTILRGFGIKHFFEARDAADAFDTFKHEAIDFIVVDQLMDFMDGVDFVRLVRTGSDSPNPFVPIIMLSAYSERSKVEKARDAGVTEFCVKPVTALDLYKKVYAVVNQPRPFIKTPHYFGPDRRRHQDKDYRGEERRRDARHEPLDEPSSNRQSRST